MKRHILFLFILTVCTMPAAAGSYNITRSFTNKEGLPNNSVSSCCFDVFGRLWIGTKDGICYYDGVRFQAFSHPDCQNGFGGVTLTLFNDSDNNIWISTNKGLGYYNPQSDEFFEIEELSDASIRDIDMDSRGNIWLTSRTLICKYDKTEGRITKFISSGQFQAESACPGRKNEMLFASRDGKVYVYDTENGTYRSISVLSETEKTEGIFLEYIAYPGDNIAIVSTSSRELRELNLENGRNRIVFYAASGNKAANISSLMVSDDDYWIGTSLGIFVMNRTNGHIEHIKADPLNKNALVGDNVRSIVSNTRGEVWIGTFQGGLNLCQDSDKNVRRYYADQEEHSIVGQIPRAFCVEGTGNIWIGTETGEMNHFIPGSEKFIDYTSAIGIPNGTIITDLLIFGNRLYISTYGGGIYMYELDGDRPARKLDSPIKYCLCLTETKGGGICIGTAKGAFSLDAQSETLHKIDEVGDVFVHSIYEDHNGSLWIGTYGFGIKIVNPTTNSCININYDKGLQSNYVTSFFEDSGKRMWMSTDGAGVGYIDADAGGNWSFPIRHITRQDGLPSNNICSVQESRDGEIWLSSSNGLVELNRSENSVRNVFLQSDEVVGGNFIYGASCYADDVMYFGSSRGMIAFNPEMISDPSIDRKLYITDIYAGSPRRKIPFALEDNYRQSAIRLKKQDASFLSVSFFSPYRDVTNLTQYEYSLKGRSASNALKTTDNYAVYTDLRPGKYVFQVKISGSDSSAAQKQIQIIVIPPWFRSTLAICLYSAFLLALLILAFLRSKRKMELEEQAKMNLLKEQKERDIYEAKLSFFTNITHEIRTPLTLIKIPVDRIMRDGHLPEQHLQDLLMIKSNTDRLLHLSNQLLDMRKLESTQSRHFFSEVDIKALLLKSAKEFETLANQKGMSIDISLPAYDVMAICSNDYVESIVSNLLSNAVKYGRKQIQIQLMTSDDDRNIRIRVNSDGPAIPAESSEKIFEPFYQLGGNDISNSAAGSGLGLTYSRTLSKIHNGALYLDINRKDCNSFVLELPKDHKEKVMPSAGTYEPVQQNEDAYDNELHSVLIVEDDAEMRQLICRELGSDFNVFSAVHGADALDCLKKHRIDLVVSDIMMPVMNGCHLCDAIKGNLEYSHIPVILITAAVGVDTHISSLKSGADSYLEKPLSMDLLKSTIENLFHNREIANRQFINSPLAHFNSTTFSKTDQDFMNKLHTLIIEHLSDSEMSLDSIAEMMFTSRSSLCRKVKADTGLTVNEYIKLCRMKKAAELLSLNQYRVNEVAYLVGFTVSVSRVTY